MSTKFSLKASLLALLVIARCGLFAQTANVQIIHNCADPLADSVDVYVNGSKLLSNFAFRTATAYTPVPAGVVLNVGIAPKNSMSVADTLKSFAVGPLAADSNYVAIASGVVGNGFAANPNSLSTSFTLNYILNSKQSASSGNVAINVFHGVTDAPGVDVKLTGGPTIINNLQYGSASGYLTLPASWYPISVYASGTSIDAGDYLADLSSLGGGAAVVLASGFLTPASNNNGPGFELIAVLPNGTVITLPTQTFAHVQVAHNCADPAADSVDVYLDGTKAIGSFKFRTATPFIPVLANVNHKIAIAPANSSSVADAIVTFDSISLVANKNYVVVASGVVGMGFAPNPSGINTAFTLAVLADARTSASTTGKVDVAVFHGATDAPAVTVGVQGGSDLVQGLKYLQATSYVEVPALSYTLQIKDSAGTNIIAQYLANLTSLADSAGVVYASGFLNPANNNNGPAFGLYLSLPSGGPFIPLAAVTGIKDINNDLGVTIYPNPASNQAFVKFNLDHAAHISADIFDATGRKAESLLSGSYLQGEQEIVINTAGLVNGLYLIKIVDNDKVNTYKFLVSK